MEAAVRRLITYFKRCIEEGGDAKNTWTKMCCVQTLDEDEIRNGVPLGEPYLHPISDSFKFRFWDGDVDFLPLKKDSKKTPTAWEIAEFKGAQRPTGVHWVAPILDKKNPSNWRFLMYGFSESNSPVYIGRSKSWSPKARWKDPWPILNGAREQENPPGQALIVGLHTLVVPSSKLPFLLLSIALDIIPTVTLYPGASASRHFVFS